MTSFRIDVVIDPAQSAAGAKAVERQLDGLEREAAELRQALVDALSVREAGSTAALGRLEDVLIATQQRAIVTDARISQIGKDINARPLRTFNSELTKTQQLAAGASSLLTRAFAGVSVALALREYVQLSDALTNVQNRLRLVTTSEAELAQTQAELLAISERSRSSFSGTAEIFNRLAVSGKELGVTNQQLLQFTESLNQAIILSGASAQEAQAGLIQLSQGLASGTLRGDELRSVLEQLPAVADVIAKGLGVTRGELRKLGEDGKITAQSVLDAFAKARGELNDRFATTVPTVGQAFTVLGTEVTKLVDQFNALTGANRLLADGLLELASLFDFVREPIENIDKDAAGSFNSIGASINNVKRELAALAAIQERSGQLSESQQSRIELLNRRLADYTLQARSATMGSDDFAKKQKEVADAAAAAAKQQTENKKATERQAELLQKIRGPFEQYAQTQRDLQALLAANKITQTEFNTALEDAKPPSTSGTAGADPFAAQLESLKAQNDELRIRAQNFGLQREGLLIENELAKQGVTLTREQQLQLASALLARQELTGKVKEQADQEERLARLAAEQETRVSRLRDQVAVNEQINQQIEDLLVLKAREKELTDEVDAAVENLRLRQLETSNELGAGFERAFIRIKQEAEDLASVAEGIVNVFANNATNAVVEFARTGQFSFKEFASAILEDITRIIARLLVVQAITAAVNAFGGGTGASTLGALGALGGGGGRARGGTVQPGTAYPVGEEGPEMFVPNRTGTIVPNPASVQPSPQPVTVQVVNVQNPNAVPEAIAEGLADEAIVNVLTRKRETIRQLAV